MQADQALLAATALHAGFQLVVTVVVYPALADVPPDRWQQAHAAHSRRIVGVVGVAYVAVASAGLWALVVLPLSLPLVAALAGNALAVQMTALVAAPAHSRLGRDGHAAVVLDRLLRGDRVRLAGALVALTGSLWV